MSIHMHIGSGARALRQGHNTAPPTSSKPPFQPAFPSHAKMLVASAVPCEHQVFSCPVIRDDSSQERSRQLSQHLSCIIIP